MEQYFPKHKIVLTGNPIRSDLFNLRSIKPEALQFFGLENTKKTLLIIGGSLGARTINQAIIGGIEKLLAQNYQIIWQTGNTDFGRIQTALSEKNLLLNSNLVVKDFMYAMQFAYAAADVVISRAGALAISELCLAEKPAILIPLPSAAEDHQTKNANTLVEKDAALLVKDSEAKEILVQTAIHLLENIALQTKLQTNIQTFAKPNAAQEIVQEIVKLLQ
jgi:UDP-N-acetylglucosamine--N-acetylmuramyl-(pentapeptide) pyrophosphoryl-undecaprenol N-acetylglucosamine transferase